VRCFSTASSTAAGVRDQQFVFADQGPCERRMIRAPAQSQAGCACACEAHWAGRSVFRPRSADRLPPHASRRLDRWPETVGQTAYHSAGPARRVLPEVNDLSSWIKACASRLSGRFVAQSLHRFHFVLLRDFARDFSTLDPYRALVPAAFEPHPKTESLDVS